MYIPGYFKLYESLNNINENNSKQKYMILEPMCSILRMILYSYKEKGTKISIYDNSIQYNGPSFIQGFVRNINGDKKDDLHNLYHPFLKCFEWYDKNDEIYNYFYYKCINGLERLVDIYEKNSIIHHTITHYIQIFNDLLEDNKLNRYSQSKESPLLNDLKDIWKKDELIIIYKYLQLIDDKCNDEEKEIYIKNIDEFISLKEKKVYDYINKYSTTYN